MKNNETVSLSKLHEVERILVTAHRGDSLEYPENTLLSMEKAVEAGADFIEFDLFATKDNVPILLHDPTLKRTANAKGRRLYREYDMYDKGYFTIEDEKVIEVVRSIDRDIAICFTPGWLERADEANLRRCAELGCKFFQPIRETLTVEKLELARSLGLRANAFYADNEIDFEFLLGVGCPGILTNAPARLVNWLGLVQTR